MSRIGKLPINLPQGVSVEVSSVAVVVKGAKEELRVNLPAEVEIKQEGNVLSVTSKHSNLQGLVRTLVANAVTGVTTGWTKTLELSGTGYRANTNGQELNLALGFSHPVVIKSPQGIKFEVVENKIHVKGADRGLVGEIAAKIRKLRPADPYKLKGFKYEGEKIIKKAGKAAKAGATAGK